MQMEKYDSKTWGHVSDIFLALFFNSSFIVSVMHPARDLCHLACSGLNPLLSDSGFNLVSPKWLETCQHNFSRLAWSGDAIKIPIAALHYLSCLAICAIHTNCSQWWYSKPNLNILLNHGNIAHNKPQWNPRSIGSYYHLWLRNT